MTELTARILIAVIFLVAGFGKIGSFSATQSYMESAGVPGGLLPLVIILEAGGAIAVILGWQTRYTALALAAFTLIAALLFHNDLSDQMQAILFLKNLAITGAFLLLVVHGAGEFSLDARTARMEDNGSKSL
ncbi:MAG: DoxX family protein [Methylococcales bacterium]